MLNKNIKLRTVTFLFIAIFSINALFARKQFESISESKIIVKGTSTFHDRHMESQMFDCTVTLGETINDTAAVGQVIFSLQVETLKSGQSGLDKNAYKALKTSVIQFRSSLLHPVEITPMKVSGILGGDLTIAGTTKPVSIPFEGRIINENEMESDVVYKINMKEFGIKPPTFMFGAMKTGPEVEVIIHLQLRTIT